jgi:hypothetical protein
VRVSKYFKLGRTQPTLDFVDVSYSRDTRLFLSPRALTTLPSPWGRECVHLIQDFFDTVLQHIKAGRHAAAEDLLKALKEPNETHLGMSSGASRGRALGDGSAHDVWRALSQSRAAKSGLIKDLEDTVLLIEGISVDIISDITTNIIRGPLIQYTHTMATQYGIPLSGGLASGPIWNSKSKVWEEVFVDLPLTPSGKLLLVPKIIVRQIPAYSLDEYYRHYILTHLQQVELDLNSSLVHVVKKTKQRKVYKSKIEEKYGSTKRDIIRETINHPDILDKYRAEKDNKPSLPLDHDLIAAAEGTEKPKWSDLLSAVINTPSGKNDAENYETRVEALLTALFYPDLTSPIIQHKIHDGRKRIDISYTNMATAGFFKWLSNHYPSAMIFVECKNYGAEIANPELDQISGRFSPSRGKVGLLICRSFKNKSHFEKRCIDTAKDNRGFVLTIDDTDLTSLVQSRKDDKNYRGWPLLDSLFKTLIS